MHNNEEPEGPYRPKPGDRVFRVPRARPFRIVVGRQRRRSTIGVSLWSLVYGFVIIIVIGTILLMLPAASRSGSWTSPINSLFTATSSVCVTGLVVVDTFDYWSFFGQFVIFLLIQLGGLGFMTSTTILLMAARRRIGLRTRMLISESAGILGIGGVVKLTRNIALFSLVSEAVGAIIFFTRFSENYDWQTGAWKSVFQAVSAFNNAGFDLFGGFRSLTGYQNDNLVLLTTAGLIILGGISFMALQNTFRSHGPHRSSVDTKMVLLITAILLFFGTAVIFATEFSNNRTLGTLSLPGKIVNAFFQAATARTAGFETINIGAMETFGLFFLMMLMFIGGASGSTAGGIKVNTAGLIVATVWNTIRGREFPGAFGREFPIQQVFRAMTLLVMALVIIAVAVLILSITEKFLFIDILFESVSAFGTVGLTAGITPELSIPGRLVIIMLMFIGRLGPLTLILALVGYQKVTLSHYPKETIRIG